MNKLLYEQETYALLGACFEVYNDKGPGFLEAVYQECLEIELRLREVPAVPQGALSLTYKGQTLQQRYVPDFLCYDGIIMEIKAVSNLTDEHRAQAHNYLKATGHRLALLVNFCSPKKLEHERIIR